MGSLVLALERSPALAPTLKAALLVMALAVATGLVLVSATASAFSLAFVPATEAGFTDGETEDEAFDSVETILSQEAFASFLAVWLAEVGAAERVGDA